MVTCISLDFLDKQYV